MKRIGIISFCLAVLVIFTLFASRDVKHPTYEVLLRRGDDPTVKEAYVRVTENDSVNRLFELSDELSLNYGLSDTEEGGELYSIRIGDGTRTILGFEIFEDCIKRHGMRYENDTSLLIEEIEKYFK